MNEIRRKTRSRRAWRSGSVLTLGSAALLLLGPSSPAAAADGQWSRLTTIGYVPPTIRPWLVLDASGSKMYMLRDTIEIGGYPLPPDTLYTLDLATGVWAAPIADTIYAGARMTVHGQTALHPMIDPPRHRLINLLSISGDSGNLLTGGAQWNLTGPPGWGSMPLANGTMEARGDPGFAYDPGRNVVWMAGGAHLPCGACIEQNFTDLWSLDLTNDQWTSAPVTPSACAMSPRTPMFLDTWNDRLLLMGAYEDFYAGCPIVGGCSSAVWQMPLHGTMQWTPLSREPSPAPTGTFVFDSNRGRMLAVDVLNGIVRANKLTSDSTWTPLTVTGTWPPTRGYAAVVFDSTGDRVLVFGGIYSPTTYNDVWQLVFDHTTPVLASVHDAAFRDGAVRIQWIVDGIDVARFRIERRTGGGEWTPVGTATASGDGAVSFTDSDVQPATSYDYRLAWSAAGGGAQSAGEVSVRVPARLPLSIRAVTSGPAGLWVRLTLPDDRPAVLECFDAGGRRWEWLDLSGLGAGVHAMRVDTGRTLPSGVWLVRVRQAGVSQSTRAVVLR